MARQTSIPTQLEETPNVSGLAKPCVYCGKIPSQKQNEDGFYLECSNLIDCTGWPYTEPLPTRDESIAAWNAITK